MRNITGLICSTLNLTINNSSSSTEDVTVCDSFDWNGVTYTESGVYTLSLPMSLVVQILLH